jgi:ribosomal protein S12 methylthiotransferase accessory factor
MRVQTTYLNSFIPFLEPEFQEERAEQLRTLSRLYNRMLGPVVGLNILRPEILDLAIYSSYCHHVPVTGLMRDALVRIGPYSSQIAGGGKGFRQVDAALGALGEMAERLLGTLHFRGAADRIRHATYDDLARAGIPALSPDDLPLFAPEQYAHPDFPYAQFRRDTLLGWVEGTELLTGSRIQVPAQLVLMYYKSHPLEPPIGYGTTAGGSFHTSRTAAVLHGLYEVIERDALNISWYCKMAPARVDVDLQSVLRQQMGLRQTRLATPYIDSVGIYYIRIDTRVPVLAAIAVDKSRDERAFLGGSGGASQRKLALNQALCELGQCQTAFRFDDPFGRNPIGPETPLSEVVEFFDAPLYFGHARNLPRTYWYTSSSEVVAWDAVANFEYPDDHHEYEAMRQWLQTTEFRPIVLDCDDACWPGAVVTKVFVPQLTHACPPRNPMLGHPRFYKVPRALGHMTRNLTFTDLSTDPIPFA